MHRPPRSRAVSKYHYRRTYKACIPCRERKVKCEPVDDAQPPCSRCERMKLHCRFTEKQPWARKNAGLVPDVRDHASDIQMRFNQARRSETAEGQADTYSDSNKNSVTAVQHMLPICNDPFSLFLRGIPSTSPFLPTNHSGDTVRSDRQNPVESDTRRVWNACRFVKMGWLTAQEAITLVDLFFANMSPLSPILTDFYNYSSNHYWLVTQEPMLCCTILMISSRYHVLPGLGGIARAYSIHHRFWQHCQHLILRIMLGQEKLSKAKTRHVGSIEALLLMSEWYPRAVNFPPENDGWDSDLILTEPDLRNPPASPEDIPMSDCWREDVVEPTRRSDRMSWMLVSTALALAHELGLFKAGQGSRETDFEATVMRPDAEKYLQHLEWRCCRLPSLLYVFGNLLATRLGCTSLTPDVPVVKPAVSPHADRERIDFMASWHIRSHLSTILDIEHHYLQVFSNSIKVQSLVEKFLASPNQSFPTDRICIDEVISSSCTILQSILSLPNIPYFPIRVFLRVISSSIFLMKALALGVRTAQLHTSISLLEQTISTLQSSALDDVQIVSRYVSLLQIHVSRLRETFTASAQEREKDLQDNEQIVSLSMQSEAPVNDWEDPVLRQRNGGAEDDWLSLPFDPLMAPFGAWDDNGQADYGLDSSYLDLDFIWNLPA
ncbi:hypothetical protein BBP40_004249 [Aspergillus hancockii]|nr:hypothetical protein BBP40_004249 [Aspergillus hancockii]